MAQRATRRFVQTAGRMRKRVPNWDGERGLVADSFVQRVVEGRFSESESPPLDFAWDER